MLAQPLPTARGLGGLDLADGLIPSPSECEAHKISEAVRNWRVDVGAGNEAPHSRRQFDSRAPRA